MAARADLTADPALRSGLLDARRGQAYFSRKLAELTGADFDTPSLLAGWSRRHVIAHVGLNARALTRLTEWASTGVETPMYESPTHRVEEIQFSATLPVQALRNLSEHAAIHLNVEWRDMPDEVWRREVRTALGRSVPVSETVWMRTREVWIHAVDLGNGGTFDDFPAAVITRLLADVAAAWSGRPPEAGVPSLVLLPNDREAAVIVSGAGSPTTISGPAAALARWATGRGASTALQAEGGSVPPPPPWL